MYKDMEAMRAALRNLVYLSPTRNLMYVTDVIKDKPVGNMQHLSCYFPALLALVNHLLPDTVYSSTIEKETFALAAEGLAETCYILYEDQISGLGPEEVKFYSTVSGDDDAIHKAGTWMELMEKWIEEGKNLDRKDVPGSHRFNPLKSLRTETSRAKEYSVKDSGWYLRPEVSRV
jgi:mannosyl-oligosaccharide alpha-1,2-mannosidase